jgi:hypothetical protein
MSVPRTLPVFLSVLFAVGLWIYGSLILRTDVDIQGGYATLVCGDSCSDPEIRERLDSRGLTGLVSESDQWFLLDCFGSVEKIPLVEYSERLLPFDPRNDGYAEKLRSLFVRDGKRYVYIQLAANSPEKLEAEIAAALNGVSYSLEYARGTPGKHDIFLPLIAFSLTACIFFAIPALRRRLNAGFLPCLTALSPLALGLAPGFAMAALLAGFAALLAEGGRQQPYNSSMPFAQKWLLAFAFIACYVCFSFFSGLPVHFALLVLALFCCALAVSVRTGGGKLFTGFAVKKWYPQRRRFNPVQIISRPAVSYGFFPVMLPFAAMALALAFAGLARPHTPSTPASADAAAPAVYVSPLPAGAVTEVDFREHFLFQSAFSFRALGKKDAYGGAPAGYELSSNGLLAPAAPGVDQEPQIPEFPLGEFLRGISTVSVRAGNREDHGNPAAVDLLLALPPVIFILPALYYSIKKKKQSKTGFAFRGFSRYTC